MSIRSHLNQRLNLCFFIRVFPAGQQGSILIATIIAMTIIATLGTTMYSYVSTSNLNQIASMSDTKAYYLAESGGHFAVKQLTSIDSGNSTARNTLLASLASTPYTVNNTGQFQLQNFTYSTSPGFHEYRFSAKGSPTDGLASRSINYIIKVPNAAGESIPFTGTGHTLNTNNWEVTGSADLDSGDNKVALNDGSGNTQISMNWTNASSTLPNLLDTWNDSGGFLTYEVQAKFRLSTDHDVLAGISFRLNTGPTSSINDDSFYGASYLWCKDHTDLATFCGSDTSKTYIILWRQASNGAKTIIGKQLASSVPTSPSLVSSGKLVSWATLVVRVQEQLNPTTLNRENLIYVFAGSPNGSPSWNQKGTTEWSYSNLSAVKWSTSFSGTDCSGGELSCVSDPTLTTSNFASQTPNEIGLHAFGNEKAEVTDLGLRFNFNGGQATTY